MRQSALAGFTTATDLADYLVRKNIPFRDAHELVGAAVQRAVELGSPLEALSLQQLNGADSGPITEDVYAILTLEGSVSAETIWVEQHPVKSSCRLQRRSNVYSGRCEQPLVFNKRPRLLSLLP